MGSADAPMPSLFQSTLPSRGATCTSSALTHHFVISIHAPLAGSDTKLWSLIVMKLNFNPRSPRGERLTAGGSTRAWTSNFNPRSPRGERLSPLAGCPDSMWISIHAPLAGSDLRNLDCVRKRYISIHAPLAGSDSETAQRHRYVL